MDKRFLGFDSVLDFAYSLFGLKTPVFNFIMAVLFGISGFVTNYVYDSFEAVYLLWILMFIDWITGVLKSMKLKSFVSHRLYRMPLYFLATTVILALGWNMAKYSIVFIPVPGFIIGGFYSVYFISILENLGELELLPKSMVKALKSRFGLKNLQEKLAKEKEQN
jgi:phage-related holin